MFGIRDIYRNLWGVSGEIIVSKHKMAVLGPKGTFSDRAFVEYNKLIEDGDKDNTYEGVYCQTIDEVFEKVCPASGEAECDIGIVPIENTLDGYVLRTLDLLHEKESWIVDENMVEVQFSLLANTDSVEDIEKLYVQFKTNGQCRNFINTLKDVEIITTESNMDSYYKMGDKKGEAAIVPRHIARVDEGRFTIDYVTDAKVNFTRFVIFKRRTKAFYDLDDLKEKTKEKNFELGQKVRIPVYIMPVTDRPGILFEILKVFHEHNINLISIMSRPTKQEMGTYNFYLEIDGLYDRIDMIFDALTRISEMFDSKVLGIYGE